MKHFMDQLTTNFPLNLKNLKERLIYVIAAQIQKNISIYEVYDERFADVYIGKKG